MVRAILIVLLLSAGGCVACAGPNNGLVIGGSNPEQSEYPSWFDKSFSKSQENFKNSVRTGDHLQCVFKFGVLRSGEIQSIELIETSGNDSFDAARRGAIELSSPLSGLPDEWDENQLVITAPFANR